MPSQPSRKLVWIMLLRWLPLVGAIATPSWRSEAAVHPWRFSMPSVAASRLLLPCYATVGWPRSASTPPLIKLTITHNFRELRERPEGQVVDNKKGADDNKL